MSITGEAVPPPVGGKPTGMGLERINEQFI